MLNSKPNNKTPSGISIDINDYPNDNSSDSLFGFSKSSNNGSMFESNSDSSNDSSNSYINSIMSNTKSNYIRIGLIIVILLFLGINIFSYLGDFSQKIKDVSSPLFGNILKTFGLIVTDTTKDVIELTASGSKLGIDVVSGSTESGIDVIQGQLDNVDNNDKYSSSNKNVLSDSLTSALSDAEYKSDPLPDDATSSTQRNSNSKSGYCYIGEDRGFRSCISVTEGDHCMSGNIFPTNEICINPSLRE